MERNTPPDANTTSLMNKWEYRTVKATGELDTKVLNEAGMDGWELVSIHVREIQQNNQAFNRHANPLVYTFKRPLDYAI